MSEHPAAPRSRQAQIQAVADVANAAALLLLDLKRGRARRLRATSCGHTKCPFSSCRLAAAITAYITVADA